MRAAFSLVGLLIGVFILMYVWSQNTAAVSSASKQATADAQQFAGRDEEGVPAKESIKLDPFLRNGKVTGVLVANVTAGGAMEKYYGLKRGDVIVAAGQIDLRDQDDDMALALIFQEGYQKKGELRVKRGPKEMLLPSGQVLSDATPQPAQPATPAAAAATAQQEKQTPTAGDHAKTPEPERPAGQSDTRSALQRQLDSLPGVRRSE
jgi:hypothetical protein